MKRPDIQMYKEGLKECCGRDEHPGFCETWGCSQIAELINWIEYLEAQPEDSADAAASDMKPCGVCGTLHHCNTVCPKCHG